jgi:hypothetical protein
MTQEPVPEQEGWTVQIPLPWGTNWLNLNKAPSGEKERNTFNGWKRKFRRTAYEALQDAGVPQGLGRIRLQVTLHFPDRRVHDPSNVRPTVKPMIDALQPHREYTRRYNRVVYGKRQQGVEKVIEWGWGVIPGDDPRYLVEPEPLIGEPIGRDPTCKGVVVFHIVPLPEQEKPS